MVELDSEFGQFVASAEQLVGNTGFEVAFGQAAHAALQRADGLGNIAGKDIGQKQADDDDEAEDDELVPHRRHFHAGNHQRGRQAGGLLFVPIGQHEDVFFAQWVVGHAHGAGVGVFGGEFAGGQDACGLDLALENIGFAVAGNHEDVVERGGVVPVLQGFAHAGEAAGLKHGNGAVEQAGFEGALLFETAFGHSVLHQPEGEAGHENGGDDDEEEGEENPLEQFHEYALAGRFARPQNNAAVSRFRLGGGRWVEGQMKERYFQVTFIPFDEGYLKA